MTCRALGISKDGLFNPSIVPFAPCWTVCFNSRFRSFSSDEEYENTDPSAITYKRVLEWRDEHASGVMVVMGSGEVLCEDETDATLLLLAFR
jgi:hypothetical protein